MKKLHAFFIGLVLCNYLQGSSKNLNIQQKQECRDAFRREIQDRQRLRNLIDHSYTLVTLISRLKFPDCPSSCTGKYGMFFSEKEQNAIQEYYNILQQLQYVTSDEELLSFVDTNADKYYQNKKIIDKAEVTHQSSIKALAFQW